jgi:hypothetical protein
MTPERVPVKVDFTLTPETWLKTFDGFYDPIKMEGVVNDAKTGQTIPIKWYMYNQDGPVVDLSIVQLRSYPVDCLTGESEAWVDEYSSGSSGLQNLGDGNYQYNWKTPKAYAGTCREMYIEFDNGQTSPVAIFKFK